jgi:dihydroorotate dehydrogenase (NAD+) catalytic subunit
MSILDWIRLTIFSWGYRVARVLISAGVSFFQRFSGKPQDFEAVILTGHRLLKWASRWANGFFFFSIPQGLSVSVYHLKFPSPIILAAFEGDLDVVEAWQKFGLGAVTLKTVLTQPRVGNARPRIQKIQTDLGEGLINAMGLPSKGVDYFCDHASDLDRFPTDRPLGISIGGHSPDEYYSTICRVMDLHLTRPFFLEINISCPNTAEGQDMLKNPDLLSGLLTRVRQVYPDVVLSVKLSPDQSDDRLLHFGQLCTAFKWMCLTLGNTQYRTCESVGLLKQNISIGGGGMSGPLLFDRTLHMVKLLAPLGLPIIAVGGIHSVGQIQQLHSAGATLFGMATAIVQDPYRVPKILRQLS